MSKKKNKQKKKESKSRLKYNLFFNQKNIIDFKTQKFYNRNRGLINL